MIDRTFKFTPLRMGVPLDNLNAAISIIQTQILATGADWNTGVTFGQWHLPTDQMQVAVALLVELMGPVEDLQWAPKPAP